MKTKPAAFASAVIDTTPQRVWQLIRDFNGLPIWHPLVEDSRIEAGLDSATVGCVRDFRLTDGGKIREQLLALSDYDFVCTYSIIESPMPVSSYVATLKLLPITDGERCYAEWSCSFDCPSDQRQDLSEHISSNVFAAGLKAIQQRFK